MKGFLGIIFFAFFVQLATLEAHWHHDHVYIADPWYHPTQVVYGGAYYRPVYYGDYPYYYYSPQYYYYATPAVVIAR